MSILKVTVFVGLTFVLVACKVELTNVEDDDQEDKNVVLVERTKSSETETIDHNELYDFELRGESNTLFLKANLRRITINGGHNNVTIVEDDFIERLIIDGDGNTFTIESSSVTVDEIIVDGNNNFLEFSSCQALTDTGSDNQIVLLESTGC
jgi:hypothetical protein